MNRGWCARCGKEIPRDQGLETPIGKIHVECDMMPAPRAADLLGVSVSQFRRLIVELEIGSDEEFKNPHYKSGPPMMLYAQPKIAALQDHPAVVSARTRKGAHIRKDYTSIFASRFGAPREALPAACEAMFNLNRYTRHSTCSDAHRQEIFDLKTELIEHLYERERFTDRVEKLMRRLPEKECFRCEGSGNDGHADCEKCDGTGVFAEARDVASYEFSFTVEGQHYTWMQPDRVVTFEPRVEETRPDDGKPRELETTLNIPRTKLAEAKALVRYALSAVLEREQGTVD